MPHPARHIPACSPAPGAGGGGPSPDISMSFRFPAPAKALSGEGGMGACGVPSRCFRVCLGEPHPGAPSTGGGPLRLSHQRPGSGQVLPRRQRPARRPENRGAQRGPRWRRGPGGSRSGPGAGGRGSPRPPRPSAPCALRPLPGPQAHPGKTRVTWSDVACSDWPAWTPRPPLIGAGTVIDGRPGGGLGRRAPGPGPVASTRLPPFPPRARGFWAADEVGRGVTGRAWPRHGPPEPVIGAVRGLLPEA